MLAASTGVRQAFQTVLEHHTAGDPMQPNVRWTNLSLTEIAAEMNALGEPVSRPTVKELLHDAGLGRRKAVKKQTMGDCVGRNEQFEIIAELKEDYRDQGLPIISIDTTKRELLGNFRRDGETFNTAPLVTFDHDYPSFASGVVIPHGIYDLSRNVGHITLGLSHDTSEFACDSLYQWWRKYGQRVWSHAPCMLLLCDAGGSNSYRKNTFKFHLQRIVNKIGIPVRVAHYPSYCSRFNPIDHRLFPHVARACRGVIFHSIQTVVDAMRRTKTATGLRVTLNIITRPYEYGEHIPSRLMDSLDVYHLDDLPQWNYWVWPQS